MHSNECILCIYWPLVCEVGKLNRSPVYLFIAGSELIVMAFYCNLTASKIRRMENKENMENLSDIFSTRYSRKHYIYQVDNSNGNSGSLSSYKKSLPMPKALFAAIFEHLSGQLALPQVATISW